ncbi:MAG: hypothetical protein HN894_10500, partial [Bacteroidetes bacterium]|nr:hypothetical protein [Bacteroidota bacterium]
MIRINKITIILTSPFLLSLFLLIPVVYFIPSQFSKYKTELLSSTAYQTDEEIFYYDLDKDGTSEKILLLHNSFDGISLSVFKQDAVINQWNFEGKICGTGNIFFSDLNSDGITEISLIMAEFNPNY